MRPPAFSIFSSKLAFAFLLILVFGLGLFLRLIDLSNPPLEFHPTRQFFGAIRARALYQQTAPDIPEWQRDLSARFMTREAQLEPLLLEHAAAFLYRWTGENLAVPRALSAGFWVLGGVFLFLLTRRLTDSSGAALAALCFYLFLPYGVSASHSFQPDPLMILFLLAFWWAFQRWSQNIAAWRWAILAGTLGGLTIYIKLTAVFFVAGGAIGLLLAGQKFLAAFKHPQTWLLLLLGILPGGLYLYDGLLGSGFLVNEFGGRTLPALWLSLSFYLRWLDKLDNLLSPWLLVLILVSLLVFANRPTRYFSAALGLAYLVFGLLQTHHIASHDYYSLPVIPIAALGLAPLAQNLFEQIANRAQTRSRQFTLFGLVVIALLLNGAQQYLNLRRSDYRPQAQNYAAIGEILQHQPGAIAITEGYGYPLFYYGWQNASLWNPPAAENFEQDFAAQTQGKAYFIVTDLAELNRQPKLAARLETFPVLARGAAWVIYRLKP